jgi:hypothetical protein
MSDFKGFEFTREYQFKEWLRYTRSRPFVCQPFMKNYWQCFDHFHFGKNVEEGEAKSNCLEKFNYVECLNENKERWRENWVYNGEAIFPEGGAGGEEEEE